MMKNETQKHKYSEEGPATPKINTGITAYL
jgi:hypothetical protein